MHVLLNPGPVNVSARVRAALAAPDRCHREPEYFDVQDAIRARLPLALDAPTADYTSVLLTGSGTAMVEAMVSSCVPPTGRLLVIENGVYGQRIARIAAAHGIACDTVPAAWTERPAVDAVERSLATASYSAVAVVHHETTTGLLNDLETLAPLVHARGARLLVDAVSSLGGERFNFAAWRPAAVACTANKCVQGLPGISFALVRRDVMAAMERDPERSLYLHLPRHHAEQERRSTPFTPAIQIADALLAALGELIDESLEGRIARYARAAAIVRDGMESAGIALMLPRPVRSNTLTAARLPAGVTYEALHDALKREGFVIYAGQAQFATSAFRVANMGAIDASEFHRFARALRSALA